MKSKGIYLLYNPLLIFSGLENMNYTEVYIVHTVMN